MFDQKIIFNFLILFFSLTAHAQGHLDFEDYGPIPDGAEKIQTPTAKDFEWLYQLLMTETDRLSQPKETQRSFEVHLADTHEHFPHPDLILNKNLKSKNQITGKITYAGFFRKAYKYDVISSVAGYTLVVRVYFKNKTAADHQAFTEKFKQAEQIWNQTKPELDFNYQFQFQITDDPQRAHFKVNLLDSTRGPYDTNWARNWTSYVVAHEIGHMLGLGDEYHTISGKTECLMPSLMCACWSGSLQPHHYYFVLRRLIE